jgi:hypothetical protein
MSVQGCATASLARNCVANAGLQSRSSGGPGRNERDLQLFCLDVDLSCSEVCRTCYDRHGQKPNLASALAEKVPAESRPRVEKAHPLGRGKHCRKTKSQAIHFPRRRKSSAPARPAHGTRVQRMVPGMDVETESEANAFDRLLHEYRTQTVTSSGQLPPVRKPEGRRSSPVGGRAHAGAGNLA